MRVPKSDRRGSRSAYVRIDCPAGFGGRRMRPPSKDGSRPGPRRRPRDGPKNCRRRSASRDARRPDHPAGGADQRRRQQGARRSSNEYGTRPLMIGAAHRAGRQGRCGRGRLAQALTFGGQPSRWSRRARRIVSDPVDLAVPPLRQRRRQPLPAGRSRRPRPVHWDGRQTAYISGPAITRPSRLQAGQHDQVALFLSEILVDAAARRARRRHLRRFDHRRRRLDASTPTTAGPTSSPSAWPRAGRNVAVVNEGISGARVLRDRMGTNALARFDRDVLSQPHADTVVLMMGINDIGWPGRCSRPTTRSRPPTTSSPATSS